MVQGDLKVGNTNSILWLNILCYTLWRHVYVTVWLTRTDMSVGWPLCNQNGHRLFKHETFIVTKYFMWQYQIIIIMLHFLCSCSYLFTFLLSSQLYWHIRLKSTAWRSDLSSVNRRRSCLSCCWSRGVEWPAQRCSVGLVAVGVQEQAEDMLVPPLLRNCLTLMTSPFQNSFPCNSFSLFRPL